MKQKLVPYPWQKECLGCWKQAKGHGIVSVVTGAGKTFLALCAAKQLIEADDSSVRVRIVVPTISLAYQWRNTILAVMGNNTPVGFCFGEVKSDPSCPWMLYVINSARYTLSRHVLKDMELGYKVLLIADECHRYGSKENSKIFDFIGHSGYQPELYFSLGLSATTECRNLNNVLIPALGHIIYRYSLDRAVQEKTVADFSISHIRLSLTAKERSKYSRLTMLIMSMMKTIRKRHPELAGLSSTALFQVLRSLAVESGPMSPEQKLVDLIDQRRMLCYLARSRVDCVADLIMELPPDARILVFCEMIEQADRLIADFREEGILKVGRYHSEMRAEARKLTLERYRDHEIRILVCCNALDEGLDVPDTAYGIVVSCSSVVRQRVQRLGRILRRSDGKNLAGLYYLYLDKTMEDPVYVDEISEEHPVCNVIYFENEREFACQRYLSLADRLIERYAQQAASDEQQAELRKNLMIGHVRNDWLMTPDTLQELAKQSVRQEEKNYWIAMEKMASLRVLENKNSNQPEKIQEPEDQDLNEP